MRTSPGGDRAHSDTGTSSILGELRETVRRFPAVILYCLPAILMEKAADFAAQAYSVAQDDATLRLVSDFRQTSPWGYAIGRNLGSFGSFYALFLLLYAALTLSSSHRIDTCSKRPYATILFWVLALSFLLFAGVSHYQTTRWFYRITQLVVPWPKSSL